MFWLKLMLSVLYCSLEHNHNAVIDMPCALVFANFKSFMYWRQHTDTRIMVNSWNMSKAQHMFSTVSISCHRTLFLLIFSLDLSVWRYRLLEFLYSMQLYLNKLYNRINQAYCFVVKITYSNKFISSVDKCRWCWVWAVRFEPVAFLPFDIQDAITVRIKKTTHQRLTTRTPSRQLQPQQTM